MTIVTATDNKPYAGRMPAVSMKTRNAELLILHPRGLGPVDAAECNREVFIAV